MVLHEPGRSRAPAARRAASRPDGRLALTTIARVFFVVVLASLCAWVLWDFIPALVWAAVIAIATWPIRQRLVRSGLGETSVALLLTLFWAVLFIVPVALLSTAFAHEATAVRDIFEQLRRGELAAPDWLVHLPLVGGYLGEWWHSHFSATAGGKPALLDQSGSGGALQFGRDVGGFIVRRLVILGFSLLTLLFLYKDGDAVARQAETVGVRLFGAPAQRYGRFSITAVRATVNGLVFVGLIEGLLLGIAYVICGVPHPISFGLATAVLGIVPFGAPVVVAIAALTLIVGSRVVLGAVLLGGGLVLIFIIDHTARPALIGGSIRLPFFWALLGVFGGLKAFGIVGLFLGPAILAVALALWREAMEEVAP